MTVLCFEASDSTGIYKLVYECATYIVHSRFEVNLQLQLCAVEPLFWIFPKSEQWGYQTPSLLKDHTARYRTLHTKVRAFTSFFCNDAVPSPSIIYSEIHRQDYIGCTVYNIYIVVFSTYLWKHGRGRQHWTIAEELSELSYLCTKSSDRKLVCSEELSGVSGNPTPSRNLAPTLKIGRHYTSGGMYALLISRFGLGLVERHRGTAQ